jgi:YfiH family protein
MKEIAHLKRTYYKVFDALDGNLSHRYSPMQSNDRHYITSYCQAQSLALLDQTHSDKVWYVNSNYITQEGDAIVTDQPGIALGIKTADCSGLLLASCDEKVIAAVHLGWRGALSNLLEKTLNLMRQFSQKPIIAVITPCIRQENYQVDEQFYHNFIATKPFSKNFFLKQKQQLYFDLPGFIDAELKKLVEATVIDSAQDTYGNEDYFSFRFAKERGIIEERRLLSCIMHHN